MQPTHTPSVMWAVPGETQDALRRHKEQLVLRRLLTHVSSIQRKKKQVKELQTMEEQGEQKGTCSPSRETMKLLLRVDVRPLYSNE